MKSKFIVLTNIQTDEMIMVAVKDISIIECFWYSRTQPMPYDVSLTNKSINVDQICGSRVTLNAKGKTGLRELLVTEHPIQISRGMIEFGVTIVYPTLPTGNETP